MTLSTFIKDEKSKNLHYLLLGHPVGHSWSPLMHNTALNYHGIEARYYAIDLLDNELTDLATFFNRETFLGANVTIPYKQLIMNYLDMVDQQADEIGAVNTIVKEEFQLTGYNTDSYGFLSPLNEFEEIIAGGRAIVFGTGGASKAIAVSLREIGLEEIFLISRNPDRINSFNRFDQVKVVSYNEWTVLAKEAILIVNATPLGMYPDTGQSPVREGEKQFLADRICYDIVYNPLQTKFLQQAKEVGAKTIGGLEMLIQQGSRSFELWTGKQFPVNVIRKKLYERFEDRTGSDRTEDS